VTDQIPQTASRLERILAYMVAGVVGLSILAFIAIIIGTAVGVGKDDGFSRGIWPAVITLPYFGLPLGFVLIIGLLVVSALRRGRDARKNGQ
jgi:hypothetical protein